VRLLSTIHWRPLLRFFTARPAIAMVSSKSLVLPKSFDDPVRLSQ
jgi:hypothetical protein